MIDERQPLQIGTRPLWLLLLNERDLTACARPTIALFLALFSKFGGHFVLFFKYYNRYHSLPHAHTYPNRLSLKPFVPVLYSLTPQPPPPACARLPACPPARLPRRQSFNGHLSRQVRDSPQLLIALAARQPVSPSAPAPTAPTARLSRPPFALLASPHEPAAVAWCPPTRTAPFPPPPSPGLASPCTSLSSFPIECRFVL